MDFNKHAAMILKINSTVLRKVERKVKDSEL